MADKYLVATYSVIKVLLSFATSGGGRAERARPKSQTWSQVKCILGLVKPEPWTGSSPYGHYIASAESDPFDQKTPQDFYELEIFSPSNRNWHLKADWRASNHDVGHQQNVTL